MSSKKAIGIAPLVTGFGLAGQSGSELLQTGSSLWAAFGLVGGCAAIFVGAGILLEWGDFSTQTTESNNPLALVWAGVALFSFVIGATLFVI